MFWLAQMSLRNRSDILKLPPPFPFVPILENYQQVLSSPFLRSFVNSLVVSSATVAIGLVLGVPAAYALSRAGFRFSKAISFGVLVVNMAPPIGFAMPFFVIYRSLGWIDTLHGLIFIYTVLTLPLTIWLMKIFFDSIPLSIEDAAKVDGASILQTFFRIALPLAAPGIGAAAILSFLGSWNEFLLALVLTRREAMTAPVGILLLQSDVGWEYGRAAAAAMIVMFPTLLLALILHKQLIRGLMAGGVKG